MRASRFFLSTTKETPADAEVISHRLMLRSGMVRRLASGLYSWMPLGLRVLHKVENIVREEMNRSGALEVLMPVVQPAELWQESGRWEQYGPELLRMGDRHDRQFCLGPTHEEVITDLVRNEIASYRQLPVNFYQIQTKFRDEIRPRFGIMRAREFVMKDAYSFHLSQESLQETYDVMHRTYCAIFDRIGLDYRPVLADTGSIGGNHSHEFHVLANSGEDAIAFSDGSDYAANVEMAEAIAPESGPTQSTGSAEEVATPGARTIAEVCSALNLTADRVVKTLVIMVAGDDGEQPLAVALRGDHELNEIKLAKYLGKTFRFARDEEITALAGSARGSLGPLDLRVPVLADRAAAALSEFACGANRDGYHRINANWGNPAAYSQSADIRNVVDGDPSPDGTGTLRIRRGIEVGHIFQLGSKYSEAMGARVLNENGSEQTLIMGCYGIGVTRVVAAAIEQNHDDRGIVWPDAIAPFRVALIPVNMRKSERVATECERIYTALLEAGVDVLFMDDPKARLGATLADVELIGIPHRLVVGERGLEAGTVEYARRGQESAEELPLEDTIAILLERLGKASP